MINRLPIPFYIQAAPLNIERGWFLFQAINMTIKIENGVRVRATHPKRNSFARARARRNTRAGNVEKRGNSFPLFHTFRIHRGRAHRDNRARPPDYGNPRRSPLPPPTAPRENSRAILPRDNSLRGETRGSSFGVRLSGRKVSLPPSLFLRPAKKGIRKGRGEGVGRSLDQLAS